MALTLANPNLSAGTAPHAQSFWPTPANPAPARIPGPEPEREVEGPGEQTQALAQILSALGNLGEVQGDEERGQGEGHGSSESPNLSGQDVLRLLEVSTKSLIQDEADAWARMLPPHDVLYLAPTTHEVYRARAADLIQTETAPRPPVTDTNRQRLLPQDDLLRNQFIRARFSVEEHRAKTPRRTV